MIEVQNTPKIEWRPICKLHDVPENEGVCAWVEGKQIAIYNFKAIGKWFASENKCPHKMQEILSRGILGTTGENYEPKIACPFHKKTFSLETGKCLSGDELSIKIYPVMIEDDFIYVGLSSDCD